MTSINDDYILPFQPQIGFNDDVNQTKFAHIHKSFKIWYLNARSISNKTEEMQHILHQIKTITGCHIPIIAITEHWIDQNTEQYYQFENYNTIFTTRDNRRGGGSAIFIHESLQFEIVYKYNDEENSFTSIRLQSAGEQFVITCVYRPPEHKSQKYQHFLQILQQHLVTIQNEKGLFDWRFQRKCST